MMEKSQPKLSDSELIEEIVAKSSSKHFAMLYERYYSRVLDKCYSLVKNKQTATDLAEDIFSKIFEKLPTFQHRSSFSSWLYTITYNQCIDHLREKKKLNYYHWSTEHEIPEIIDDTEEINENINPENLLLILDQIHPEEKALLLMKYNDELSMKQIGSALRISEDAAKMRLKRARARILYLYTQKYLKD